MFSNFLTYETYFVFEENSIIFQYIFLIILKRTDYETNIFIRLQL